MAAPATLEQEVLEHFSPRPPPPLLPLEMVRSLMVTQPAAGASAGWSAWEMKSWLASRIAASRSKSSSDSQLTCFHADFRRSILFWTWSVAFSAHTSLLLFKCMREKSNVVLDALGPRLPHVPLVLHLRALVVIEEPVLDIRIQSLRPTSRLATMQKAQRQSRRLSRSSLLALVHRSHAATTPACSIFQPWLLAAAREVPILCTHLSATREARPLVALATMTQMDQAWKSRNDAI